MREKRPCPTIWDSPGYIPQAGKVEERPEQAQRTLFKKATTNIFHKRHYSSAVPHEWQGSMEELCLQPQFPVTWIYPSNPTHHFTSSMKPFLPIFLSKILPSSAFGVHLFSMLSSLHAGPHSSGWEPAAYTWTLGLRNTDIFGWTPWTQRQTQDSCSLSLSPIVLHLCTHSMSVSLTPTSTQLHSHAHSCTITCTHPLTNSQVLTCHHIHIFLSCSSYMYVSLSTTPLAQVPRRHTNTITRAEDSSSSLSLNTPFTLTTFQCLTVLLKPGLCCAVAEREGNWLCWKEKRDGWNPDPSQTEKDDGHVWAHAEAQSAKTRTDGTKMSHLHISYILLFLLCW